ncbi:MAG: 3-hydroxyisobutyryl-CoA hydrolase [Corynebacterium sp.]|uniref:3-hydroxyisobutyryl-CoA hydrolase n=1 Tax=Corynebacterium sp. TaxID=1720 RepID=UPI00270F90E3|nr:3-hydroxyisobutyryl-CoA hydrolase [Corynebacterium sp.]
MNEQATVITSISNTTGVLQLNRPRAINALTPEMVEAVSRALRQWRDDDAVTQVLVASNSEKGFCSGGDVRWAREQVLAGKADEADEFFAVEYAMNRQIAEFPKPYVALIDGVVMGGGLGVSAHGSHRVITPAAFASMPEMAIGYVTDVGMSQVFQRLRFGPAMGRFLALTGYRLTAADMLASGLATHHVDAADGVAEAIVAEGVDQALAQLATQPQEPSRLVDMVEDIDATFGHDTWAEIDRALASHDNAEFVDLVRELIAGASPTSLTRSTELMAANLEVDLAQALDNERQVGEKMRRHPDFVEGVRAVLVDKTRDAQFTTAP